MYKKYYVLIALILMSINIYATDIRTVQITYTHNQRIEYNEIYITIRNGIISYETWQMRNEEGHEYSNTQGDIEISKEYFEYIYNRFLGIDIKNIILLNSGYVELYLPFMPAFNLQIRIGTPINFVNINIFDPKHLAKERGIEYINSLIIDLFREIDLLDFY